MCQIQAGVTRALVGNIIYSHLFGVFPAYSRFSNFTVTDRSQNSIRKLMLRNAVYHLCNRISERQVDYSLRSHFWIHFFETVWSFCEQIYSKFSSHFNFYESNVTFSHPNSKFNPAIQNAYLFFWVGGGGISAVELIFKSCMSKGALDECSH
jgi:hypothetical protein